MKGLVVRVVLLLLSTVAVGQRLPEPRLKYAALPQYPAIARQAQIQGEVKVEFVLNSDGEIASVTAVSGHCEGSAFTPTENYFAERRPSPV